MEVPDPPTAMGRRKSRHVVTENMSYEDQCRAVIIRDALARIFHPCGDTDTPSEALMEVFNGESAQNQGAVSTWKRAGPENIDAAMKRQRKEQTIAQDVSSCGSPQDIQA